VTQSAAPHRFVRGLVVAAAGLGGAVAGHVAGDGGSALSPAFWAVAAILLIAFVVLSSRTWAFTHLVLALGGTQVAVHLTLWLTSSTHGTDPRLASIAGEAPSHVHVGGLGLSPLMVAGHMLAVLAVAGLLAGIDSVVGLLWHLACTLLGNYPWGRTLVVARERPLPVVLASVPRRRASALDISPRRGPPGTLALV